MKKNGNGIYILISTIILCSFGFYAVNKLELPSYDINRIETSVSVSDDGISYGVDNIYDAVVVIQNYNGNKYLGLGSGFIYSKEGYIMTNHHVVDEGNTFKVSLMNGKIVDANLIGSDEYADIAILKIDEKEVGKIARIGNSSDAKLGDTVFTVGTPMDIKYYGTVTRGILSAKNRMVEVSVSSNSNDWIMNVMQTDAAINPGNSGGPLCNTNGDVIGVNTLKISVDNIEGIGFAVPIEDAMVFADRIVKGEETKRSYLGISMADMTTPSYNLKKYDITLDSNIKSGVIVMGCEEGTPAYDGGIRKGDVIVMLQDYEVNNIAELRYYLYKYKPNEKVHVKLFRGKEELTFDIVLGESEK